MRWGSWSYKPLGDTTVNESDVEAGDEKEEGGSPLSMLSSTSSTSRRPASESVIPVTASIAAVVFFVLFLFTPRPWLSSDRPSQIRYFGCGNSTADASAAGCRFDAMAYTWVHPKCFDQELMYDFLGQYDWSWYADEQGTQPLNRSDVMGGQHEYVYVTWKYYTTHCTYMWKKMHRSLLTSREIDSYVSDYRHTEQCVRVLADREREVDSTSVMLVAKYPSCPVVSK